MSAPIHCYIVNAEMIARTPSWQIRYHGLSTIGLRKQKAIVSSQTRNSTSRILSLLMSEFASQCLGSYVAVIHFQK